MCRDERDGEATAGQEHSEIFDFAARSEKFRLAGKLEPDLVHSRLVNWPGHGRVDLTREGERDSFFECVICRSRARGRRLA